MTSPPRDLKFRSYSFSGFTWPPTNIPAEIIERSGATACTQDSRFPCELSEAALGNKRVMQIVGFLLSNLNRAMSPMQLCVELFVHAQRVQLVAEETTRRLSGTDRPPEDFWSPPVGGDTGEHAKWSQKVQQGLALYKKILIEKWSDTSKIHWCPYGRIHDEIPILISGDPARSYPGARAGMETLLQSCLTNAWTSFESCVVDLWIKAVDMRPHSLANNVVMFPTSAKARAIQSDAKQQEPKISFTALAGHGFNVRAKMGQILSDNRRVSLDSLTGIRAAYLDAFRIPRHPRGQPSQELLEFFDGQSFGDLKCLESIRNLFAHRGGLVDDQFKAEVRPHSQILSELAGGLLLPVDGEMVTKYFKVVVSSCVFALDFVSAWLDKHKK